MAGSMISFRNNGDTYEGYLAPAEGPGVIVLQEWWGLVPHIKEVADRLAAAGICALAPDIYQGKSTEEPEEAGSLMMALRVPEVSSIVQSAITALLNRPETQGDRVGVVGFCMGGQLAMYAATIDERIGAAVNFYGIHPNFPPNLETLHAPLLGFFGGKDPMTTPEVVAELDRRLNELGKRHEFHTFEHADHAFFNDGRPEVYDAAAAERAWARMTEFFRTELTTG